MLLLISLALATPPILSRSTETVQKAFQEYVDSLPADTVLEPRLPPARKVIAGEGIGTKVRVKVPYFGHNDAITITRQGRMMLVQVSYDDVGTWLFVLPFTELARRSPAMRTNCCTIVGEITEVLTLTGRRGAVYKIPVVRAYAMWGAFSAMGDRSAFFATAD